MRLQRPGLRTVSAYLVSLLIVFLAFGYASAREHATPHRGPCVGGVWTTNLTFQGTVLEEGAATAMLVDSSGKVYFMARGDRILCARIIRIESDRLFLTIDGKDGSSSLALGDRILHPGGRGDSECVVIDRRSTIE